MSKPTKRPAGMKVPEVIRNPFGIWVRNKFAGMRLGKNTQPSDIQRINPYAGKQSHTSPIERTPHNDGHDNPTRIRHAKTRARHAAQRMTDNV